MSPSSTAPAWSARRPPPTTRTRVSARWSTAHTAKAPCRAEPYHADKLGGLVETTDVPKTLRGLTEHEARRRLAERGSVEPPASSRSHASIVRANVLTVFNLILFVAGVVTLAFGDWQDALFLAILVANTGIGIGQEIRAKRTLDRLAALVAPTAR